MAASESVAMPRQEMIMLPIRVVDAEGRPVAGVAIDPWALRSSQGHGWWHAERTGGIGPATYTTDEAGRVDVAYPRYANLSERVTTTQVTLSLDQPEFAHQSHAYINVPRPETEPHTITLERGAVVEITPIEDGKPAPRAGLYAIWNDGRSWRPGIAPTVTDDGALRIPPMPAGNGQVLLIRMEGKRATHFSPIVEMELENGATVRERVELLPAV
jgi:hypothetical protein